MIGFIVFGLVVGGVARLVVPGKQSLSLVATLVIGVIGSVIGGVAANAIGTGDLFELNIIGALVAFAAAALLIVVGEKVRTVQR